MRKFVRLLAAALITGSMVVPPLAWAQDDADASAATGQQGQDPPSRVGNLSFFENEVSQFGQDQNDWSAA
jgi:hypothetical protein